MRGGFVFVVALGSAAVLAVLAGAAVSSDIYISGKVLGRVAGKNAAVVQIAWDYKCLGEDGGDYQWTLKLVRTQPLPVRTLQLGSGTSERGDKTTQLAPGRYLPKSDPYQCETDRGQGYDKPEIGAPFLVPDYCSWVVSTARGVVELEHGTTVTAARAGSTVLAGDALATPKAGRAVLQSTVEDGTAVLAGSSRMELDAKQCARTGGWLLRLERGQLTASVAKSAGAKAIYRTATPNVTVSGSRGARWRVDYAKGRTKVHAIAGVVRVAGKTLKPGQTATV